MRRSALGDISLTVLLALQLFFLFVMEPLASTFVGVALPIAELLFVVLILVTVVVSRSRAAVVAAGFAAMGGVIAVAMRGRLPSAVTDCIDAAGAIAAIIAVSWVVARTVYSPGPITVHRVRGAFILYFNIAIAFAVIFRAIEAFGPGSFRGIDPDERPDELAADILYFSIITLSTTGFGDIVPLHRFARSMASLEAIIGQLYIATILARLITMQRPNRIPDNDDRD